MKKERQTCIMNREAQGADKLLVSGCVVFKRLARKTTVYYPRDL